MNVLILHAHPEPESFTSSLKNVAVDFFTSKGDEVTVSDLYAMNFNPVGGPGDMKNRLNPDYFSYLKEQMNAFKTDTFSDDLRTEMDKLSSADFLLLNFPLWWSSVPAIMKGWFDRVFALGYAYHPKDKLYETGVFRGKKAMLCVSAGGSQVSYTKDGANGDILEVLYHINHGTLYYSGMTVLPPFFAWRAHLSPEEELKKYIEEYREHLSRLDSYQPLF